MEKKESKIQRMAEVLPNNAATIKILKDREDIAQAKAEREKAVSYNHDHLKLIESQFLKT